MRRDPRIPEDLSCAFRKVIVPTRPRSLAGSFVFSRRKFHAVKHLSPLADTLPLDVSGNRYDQSSRLVPVTQHELRRPLICSFDLVGESLRQTIVPHMPKLNERRFG
jgi:hypothetical protein